MQNRIKYSLPRNFWKEGANKHPLSFAHLPLRWDEKEIHRHFFLWAEQWNFSVKREMKLFATLYPQKGSLLFSFESLLHSKIIMLNATCQKFPSISYRQYDHQKTLLFLLSVPMQNHARTEREFSQEITKHVASKRGKKDSKKIKCR